MKFFLALITPFFMTAMLQAQIPYDFSNLQPYYPGAIAPPYYPQAYYPQPYSVLAPYAFNANAITDNSAEIDLLTRQVQQLTNEVMQLQAQLASVQNQQTAIASEVFTPPPEVPSTPVVLVFKDGKRIDAQGYAVAGQTLWILNPSGMQRVALSQLNVAATKTENLKRGVQFPDVGY
jgi:hypothetical protein